MIGLADKASFQEAPFAVWFNANYENYKLDEDLIAKVEAAAGQNLTNPSRTRRALRAIAKPFKFVMEKSSGAVKNTIGEGIKSFWKNAAAQQRYFGKNECKCLA